MRVPASVKQLPTEKCGDQNTENRPGQVAENGANLLHAVAESKAQPDVESGSERFAEEIPQGESKPGVASGAAREVDPRPQSGDQPAAEENAGATPALRFFIEPPDALGVAYHAAESCHQLFAAPAADTVTDL